MTDILIPDVPDDVIDAIDAHAERLGLSRSEYLRRKLEQERRSTAKVTQADFRRLSDTLPDLSDPEIMKGAWD